MKESAIRSWNTDIDSELTLEKGSYSDSESDYWDGHIQTDETSTRAPLLLILIKEGFKTHLYSIWVPSHLYIKPIARPKEKIYIKPLLTQLRDRRTQFIYAFIELNYAVLTIGELGAIEA